MARQQLVIWFTDDQPDENKEFSALAAIGEKVTETNPSLSYSIEEG
jgi:hypothetical protein